jgi:[ribosomal protein S5]-alanine N-acetyltransferase
MTLAPGKDQLESERLVLRKIAGSDLQFFTGIHADAEVARYIGSGRPRSDQETLLWFQDTLSSYANLELGQLAVVRKSDEMLIGRCGLSDVAVESRVADGRALPRGWFSRSQVPAGVDVVFEPELGYTFARQYWGKGYASEAAGCVFDYVIKSGRISKLISIIHVENVRSVRLAQKFGVRQCGRVEILERPFDRYLWPVEENRLKKLEQTGPEAARGQ